MRFGRKTAGPGRGGRWLGSLRGHVARSSSGSRSPLPGLHPGPRRLPRRAPRRPARRCARLQRADAAPGRRPGPRATTPRWSASAATCARASAATRRCGGSSRASTCPTAPTPSSATTTTPDARDPFADGRPLTDLDGTPVRLLTDERGRTCASASHASRSPASTRAGPASGARATTRRASSRRTPTWRSCSRTTRRSSTRCSPGGSTSCSAGHLHGGQICIPYPGGKVRLSHRAGPLQRGRVRPRRDDHAPLARHRHDLRALPLRRPARGRDPRAAGRLRPSGRAAGRAGALPAGPARTLWWSMWRSRPTGGYGPTQGIATRASGCAGRPELATERRPCCAAVVAAPRLPPSMDGVADCG